MNNFTSLCQEMEEQEYHQVLVQELLFRSHVIGELSRKVQKLLDEDEQRKKEEKSS